MKVNSNIQAQIANNVLKANEEKYSSATERMSSGYKINHAKDSPSGMAISNKMRKQLRALEKANQNASNAINVIQTAEGGISEMQEMLQRMNELCVNAANGTKTEEDRRAIQDEIDQLRAEIDRISGDTEYNTQNLLNGEQALKGYSDNVNYDVEYYDSTFPYGDYKMTVNTVEEIYDEDGTTVIGYDVTGVTIEKDGTDITTLGGTVVCEGGKVKVTMRDGSKLEIGTNDRNLAADHLSVGDEVNMEIKGVGGMKIQVGAAEGTQIQVNIPTLNCDTLGLGRIDATGEKSAMESIDVIQRALEKISSVRSQLGAYQNRFETTVSNLDITIENLTQSYSTIKDIDMADEMVEYTTYQVLVQAGTSMLTQANEQPQQALQLLQ